MKKVFFCLLFGLFLFGCSDVNEPVKTDTSVQVSPSPKIETMQTNKIVVKPDSIRIRMLSDSVRPPTSEY